ncbi:MAG TPA: hypothetical protein VGL91_06050, partial [Acidobacteriota bacterium]
MTLSEEARRQNLKLLLRRLMDVLGEHSINIEQFDPSSKDFTDIYPTTWKEAEQCHWIKISLS